MKKVYIDGQAGTTGLQIHERLSKRSDIELLEIAPSLRKDENERKKLMQQADLVFLCLPDAAAKQAATWMEEMDTRIIDASTAHRTDANWVYGFPELSRSQKEKIQKAKRVANPGCHASGFIALVQPLVAHGLLDAAVLLHAFSITGYSGGGKQMIEDYEFHCTSDMKSAKPYALNLAHKHLPEMKSICKLDQAPLFVPIVDDFKQGMLVQVFIDAKDLHHLNASDPMTIEKLVNFYQHVYQDSPIQVFAGENALYSGTLAGKDRMELFVNGNEDGFVLSARFDNLGKGASGAAVQNMNLMLGLDEYEGLYL